MTVGLSGWPARYASALHMQALKGAAGRDIPLCSPPAQKGWSANSYLNSGMISSPNSRIVCITFSWGTRPT